MSNKNPFEIRTDLLAMAKDYLDKQQELTWEFQKKALEKMNENTTEVLTFVKENQPKTYTMKDLIDKANEMYNFVSKK